MKYSIDNENDTEGRVLDAARKVFIRKGFAGTRMQEIADEAGINKALLHYYFRSKEKLFGVVLKEAFGILFPKLIFEMSQRGHTFESKIRTFIHHYLQIIMENPYIPGFIVSELSRNPEELTHFFQKVDIDIDMITRDIARMIAKESGVNEWDARHVMVNIMSLSLFPFIGQSLLEQALFKGDSGMFEQFVEDRERVIVDMILSSLGIEGVN